MKIFVNEDLIPLQQLETRTSQNYCYPHSSVFEMISNQIQDSLILGMDVEEILIMTVYTHL